MIDTCEKCFTTTTVILCDKCDFVYCTICFTNSIVCSINEPHCINCKQLFPLSSIIKFMNRSWIDGYFKKYRMTILFHLNIAHFVNDNFKGICKCLFPKPLSTKNKCLGCNLEYNYNEIKLETTNCPKCQTVCTKGVNCFILHCKTCNALFHYKTLEQLRKYNCNNVQTSLLIKQHFQICNDKIVNLYDFENVNKKLTTKYIESKYNNYITSEDYQKKLFTSYKKLMVEREQLLLLYEIDVLMTEKIYPKSKLHQHVLKKYNEYISDIEKITKTKFIHLILKDDKFELI